MAGGIVRPPKVKLPTFIGVIWGCTVLSFIFVSLRMFARFYAFRRFGIDDYLALLSWLMLLVSAIMWSTQLRVFYAIFDLSLGKLAPTPELFAQIEHYSRVELGITFLFYFCMCTIKASFMAFIYRMRGTVKAWRIWFWCVAVFVVATYALCVGGIPYDCLLKDLQWIQQNCGTSSDINFEFGFYTNAILDAVSDLLIMSLPIFLLWKVRIPLHQKLMLMGLLSLTVVIMVVAIIRVVVVGASSNNADTTWLWLWSFIEMAVANIVASLASFRQLYMKQDSSRSSPFQTSAGSGRRFFPLRGSRPTGNAPSISSQANSIAPLYTSNSTENGSNIELESQKAKKMGRAVEMKV